MTDEESSITLESSGLQLPQSLPIPRANPIDTSDNFGDQSSQKIARSTRRSVIREHNDQQRMYRPSSWQ